MICPKWASFFNSITVTVNSFEINGGKQQSRGPCLFIEYVFFVAERWLVTKLLWKWWIWLKIILLSSSVFFSTIVVFLFCLFSSHFFFPGISPFCPLFILVFLEWCSFVKEKTKDGCSIPWWRGIYEDEIVFYAENMLS